MLESYLQFSRNSPSDIRWIRFDAFIDVRSVYRLHTYYQVASKIKILSIAPFKITTGVFIFDLLCDLLLRSDLPLAGLLLVVHLDSLLLVLVPGGSSRGLVSPPIVLNSRPHLWRHKYLVIITFDFQEAQKTTLTSAGHFHFIMRPPRETFIQDTRQEQTVHNQQQSRAIVTSGFKQHFRL